MMELVEDRAYLEKILTVCEKYNVTFKGFIHDSMNFDVRDATISSMEFFDEINTISKESTMSNEKTNETLTPAQKGKYTRLANLKKEIKKLEEESKGVQTWIFENVPNPVSVFTLAPKEHLCLSTRENWATPDNDAVINVIGMEMFLKYASITKAKIAKAGGDTAVSDLVNKGELEVKSVTQFYTLKAKC